MTAYESVWNMINWLIAEHFAVFLLCMAILAAWITAAALLVNYCVAEISAKLHVKRERKKYTCV